MVKTQITIIIQYIPFRRINHFLLAVSALDRLDLEMEADQREDETLEVLDQVVETAETVRVSRLVDINLRNRLILFLPSFSFGYQAADLAGCERDVLVPNHNLKLLEVVIKLVTQRDSSMRQ